MDARADIFSFGAVLCEMLSGRRAFQKDSRASTLAAVLIQEPAPLPSTVPHDLEKIISRCLRKDSGRLFQTMADVKVEFQELKDESDSGKLAVAGAPQSLRSRPWRWIAVGATAATLVSVMRVWLWGLRQEPAVEPTPVPFSAYVGMEGRPAFSPDGNKVAFSWMGDKDDNADIYVKQVGSTGPPMRLTSAPESDLNPAWSPDDRWIAFERAQPGRVAIVLVTPLGGPERVLTVRRLGADGLSRMPGSKWIVYSDMEPPEEFFSLWAVSIDTGERRRLTRPHVAAKSVAESPLGDFGASVAPGGRAVAFTRNASSYGEAGPIAGISCR